jgi:hemolysin activation/secretion protein
VATLTLTLVSAIGHARADTKETGRIEDRLPESSKPAQAPQTPFAADSYAPATGIQPFTLSHVEIRGGTIFSAEQLKPVVAPFVGTKVGESDLEKLTSVITQLYRERGYFLSRAIIPPQEIKGGVLQLELIEAFVSDVDASGMNSDDARSQFSQTLTERPLRLNTFERESLLLSDRYGFTIKSSQLLPDPEDHARFRLHLQVALKPVSLRLYTDNRGTTAAGPQQAYASVSLNSVFSNADRLTGSLFFTPEDTTELSFATASYSRSVLGGNLWLDVDASISQTQDNTDPFTPKSSYASERLSGKISVPLFRSRAESVWLGMSLERRHNIQDFANDAPRDETLVMLRGSLSLTEVSGHSRADLNIEGSVGLDALDASRKTDVNLSLDDARPQFAKLRLNAFASTPLWSDIRLQIQASGQFADGALPDSEEIGFGGARLGRAFDYSSLSGDTGWAAGVELRYTTSLNFGPLETVQAFVFADLGEVLNLGGNPSGTGDASLASAGSGLKLMLGNGLVASVEAARSIGGSPPSQQGSTRFFFSLSWAM